MHIALLESLGISQEALSALEAPFLQAGHTFAHYDRTNDPAVLSAHMQDADAVILANMPLPAAAIQGANRLRFIDIAFTGVDHVALREAREKGIAVSNASGYSNEAVAELALGMALSLARRMPLVEARCRNGGTKDGLVGCEIKGKTVGIVGLGKIGRRSAALFHALGTRILASSRSRHPDAPDYVTETDLETLLETADFVVLHCPLTEQTRRLINRERLARMKPTAYLLNLARGPVVDSQALADALNADHLAGAGIDVFDQEPPLPANEPLLHAKNALVTPHVAFATQESMLLRAQIVFDNLEAWMNGRQQNIV